MRRLILAGGGNEHASQLADRLLAKLLPSGSQLLYLPQATERGGAAYEAGHRWVQSVFRPLGVDRIVMWPHLEGKDDAALEPYPAVYIGGGNTFKLLHELKATGLIAVLQRFIDRGAIVYGSSAGAVILGKEIMTAAELGDVNAAGLMDTAGLDLAQGCSIWPHYRASHAARAATYAAQHQLSVIGIPERAAVFVSGEGLAAVGVEPVVVFGKGSAASYPPGSAIVVP